MTSYLTSLTETAKNKIRKYAEDACYLLSLKIVKPVRPDNYNRLLKKYDRFFMKNMGIDSKNDFCIYHILHWVLMDSGMEYVCFVESDKKRDKSEVRGDKICQEKIKDNFGKYETVMFEKVRKILCSE